MMFTFGLVLDRDVHALIVSSRPLGDGSNVDGRLSGRAASAECLDAAGNERILLFGMRKRRFILFVNAWDLLLLFIVRFAVVGGASQVVPISRSWMN